MTKTVILEDGSKVQAVAPINDLLSVTYIGDLSIKKRAEMVTTAEPGQNGNCFDYVRNVNEKLISLGITDQYVTQFWTTLQGLDEHQEQPPK